MAVLGISGCKNCSQATADGAAAGDSTKLAATGDFLQLATDRFSVRSFSDVPVEQEKIDLILRAGQVAPTAVNSQPQKILVARTPEVMAALKEVSPCIYGAPQCFVFCYDREKAVRRGDKGNYGDIDVTIVLTHMMLQAAESGVGTCIVGYYDADKLRAALDLADNLEPVLLMPFGYAAEGCTPSPKHTSYRPLEETVEYR